MSESEGPPPPGAELEGMPRDLQLEVQERIPRLEKLFKFAQPHRVRAQDISVQGFVSAAAWLDILQYGRHEYLRNMGLVSLEGGPPAPVQALVRSSTMQLMAPARFDDSLLIRVRAAYLGHRSTRFEYLADNVDTGLRHVMGETLLVCSNAQTMQSIAWPQVWRDRLAEFEGEDLQQGQR